MDPLAPRVASRHAALIPKVDVASIMAIIDDAKALLKKAEHWVAGTKAAVKKGTEGQPEGFMSAAPMKPWHDDFERLREEAEKLDDKASDHPNWHDAGVISEALDAVRNVAKTVRDDKALDSGSVHGRMRVETGKEALYATDKVDDFIKAWTRRITQEEARLKKAISQVKSFEARQKKMPGYR